MISFPVRETRRGRRFFLLRFCRVVVRVVRRAGHLDARPDAGALHGIGGADGVGDAVRGCFYGSENRHGVLCEDVVMERSCWIESDVIFCLERVAETAKRRRRARDIALVVEPEEPREIISRALFHHFNTAMHFR